MRLGRLLKWLVAGSVISSFFMRLIIEYVRAEYHGVNPLPEHVVNVVSFCSLIAPAIVTAAWVKNGGGVTLLENLLFVFCLLAGMIMLTMLSVLLF